MISIIVAASENGIIGKQGEIPWYLSRDLKNFKQLTAGNTCIMGRKTFESIVARIGKPLPERKSVIITRQKGFAAPGGCITAESWEDAMKKTVGEEVFVGGIGVDVLVAVIVGVNVNVGVDVSLAVAVAVFVGVKVDVFGGVSVLVAVAVAVNVGVLEGVTDGRVYRITSLGR